jgi:methylenetetrahydrofolate reductase (NADPH)
MFSSDKEKKEENWQSVFQPVRQPEWWQGDAKYHAPAYEEPVSELERRLKAGEFVVTSEVAPPATVATTKLKENIELIKPYVTAINFTDCPSAAARMSSWACSTIAIQQGAEPVMQIAARDRTRVGLQAEILGSNALGVRNVLCLSGDSMVLARVARRMDIVDLAATMLHCAESAIQANIDGRPSSQNTSLGQPHHLPGRISKPFEESQCGAQFFRQPCLRCRRLEMVN